ncbi:[protein-PII] uridylyltransferase [Thiomicrospira microaerophila]|uniref:[protein-PII] uridylyltransferase n=1 Tax=Thiomicrospira microaerophila TaxID=406020 RepID=UPI0005C9F06E|nr:[protein-PII] uridylyltransferase [Thiomicrospira microaerophila]
MSSQTDFPNFLSALKHQPEMAAKTGRDMLKRFNQHQFDQYDQGTPVAELVKERAVFVDQILKKIWQHLFDSTEFTLLAVGGYGRNELHPYSDIDILILCATPLNDHEAVSHFLTLLWDIGFEVGSAIRTLEETIEAAQDDITTATNLLEARWLTGNYMLFEQLHALWKKVDFWPTESFFHGKMAEQQARHKRFHDTVYQLEPNIKESPGGLRDIQTLFWVAKRHFNATSIHQLVQKRFITPEEFRELDAAYKFLSRVRFLLHRLKKRREDRLSFDNQQEVAENFGYKNTPEKLAVEQFMNSYYRNLRSVVKLNEILLQHFNEELCSDQSPTIVNINQRFQLINQYLDIRSEQVFQYFPSALLEIFIILENDPSIAGIRARTIRLLRENLHLIDDDFRRDPINKALFIEILRQPRGINASLKRMHSYGLLDAYIPVFHKIAGLMQFNIFHAYTVDEHTLLVIRHLRRFFIKEYAFEFPTAHQITKHICKPEILFLAALFHDIAKGRNGAHEILGADDAYHFCLEHNLNDTDTKLITWLVRYHLEFSSVAQRKDLSDPAVIQDFAHFVGTQNRLNYLYLLTVADICSTSDDVWNDWKNGLFLDLYNQTSNALDKAMEIPKTKTKKALLHQEKARELLAKNSLNVSDYQALWNALKKSAFFIRQTPTEICRITRELYQRQLQDINITITGKTQRGASELMIYMQNRDFLFGQITQTLDNLDLNVVEAKVYSTTENMTLVLVYFLNREQEAIEDPTMIQIIHQKLEKNLMESTPIPPSNNYRRARQIKHFNTPTEIGYRDLAKNLTEISISTKDISGLLSRIGLAFRKAEIRMHDAKINTVGEKAEDTFIISSLDNKALNIEQKQQLKTYLENEMIK